MQAHSILVVEDEAVIAAEIKYTLESLGYSVAAVAAAGEDALEYLSENGADLVLMDIMLAGRMDGVETAQKIGELFGTPVVFLTAFADEETLSRVKLTGPYGYLVKPFGGTELRITIETALYKHMMEARLKESERRLRQAEKMEAVGTMARGIAHDFNNILSAIIGYSEMCLLKVPEGDPLHKKLDQIYKAGNRAKNLVRLLLAFGRQGQVESRPVDAAPILEEALSMVETGLDEGIDVEKEIDPDAGAVLGEPTQVLQVVLNLLANAAEAMRGRGGTLRLELTRNGKNESMQADGRSMVRIGVADTGRGIHPADKERIFDPFYTTKTGGEAMGMGLAVVHGIVNGFGGWVDVDSKPESGTRFNVYLPAHNPAGAR
jgi:signal transduction histidine kinase